MHRFILFILSILQRYFGFIIIIHEFHLETKRDHCLEMNY